MVKVNFIDILGNDCSSTNKTIKINGEKIEIKTCIDTETYASAIMTISENCFKDDQYHPEYFEIVKRYAILSYFTNIDLADISLTEIFKRTQEGNWFYKIEKEVTVLPIWKCIETSAHNYIDFTIKSRKTSFDELCDSLKAITAEMAANTNSIDMDVIKKLTDRLNGLSNKEIVRNIVEEHKNDKIEYVEKV